VAPAPAAPACATCGARALSCALPTSNSTRYATAGRSARAAHGALPKVRQHLLKARVVRATGVRPVLLALCAAHRPCPPTRPPRMQPVARQPQHAHLAAGDLLMLGQPAASARGARRSEGRAGGCELAYLGGSPGAHQSYQSVPGELSAISARSLLVCVQSLVRSERLGGGKPRKVPHGCPDSLRGVGRGARARS